MFAEEEDEDNRKIEAEEAEKKKKEAEKLDKNFFRKYNAAQGKPGEHFDPEKRFGVIEGDHLIYNNISSSY